MDNTQKADDGGPAFARAGGQWKEGEGRDLSYNRPAGGASLRDYFAAAALTGLLADGKLSAKTATIAYTYADDMIQARRA